MATFGEVYRDVCENDYGIKYPDIREFLVGEYLAKTGTRNYLEIIWTASELRVPRIVRGEIFDFSLAAFSVQNELDLGIKRNQLLGHTSIDSRRSSPGDIVRMLTAGPDGLLLSPIITIPPQPDLVTAV